ncbi:hypothetical protein [Paraburkholderia humisilvae]|uniref:Uncharacterized protein n=1 Tax=Paraburkholderia humisilvae TaxID=627669 RepID=A0A6J5F7U3_9BURK|nr:hypothetical protein [Paraburkholderia humisilvae]CAB3774910.1 hypothetical protein LMG29542_08292 [Paraburkholderia humisilvae]
MTFISALTNVARDEQSFPEFNVAVSLATENALKHQIIIHGHPVQANPLSVVPRSPKSGPSLHIMDSLKIIKI